MESMVSPSSLGSSLESNLARDGPRTLSFPCFEAASLHSVRTWIPSRKKWLSAREQQSLEGHFHGRFPKTIGEMILNQLDRFTRQWYEEPREQRCLLLEPGVFHE